MTHANTSEEHLQKLKENTSPWFPTEKDTHKLLEVAAQSLEDIDAEIQAVQAGLYIQKANTIEEVKRLGEVVGVLPNDTDSLSFYKKRVLTKYQQLSQTGNPFDLLSYASVLFEVSEDTLTIENIRQEPKARINVPVQAVENTTDDIPNAVEVLQEITAATYSVEVTGLGTLKYISESDYQNDNYDPSKGYATLDENGDITDGGTYGTLY